MRRKKKLRSFLRNPLTITVPLIAAACLGWSQYILASRDLSLGEGGNLLTAGTFDDFDAGSVPHGWHIQQDGAATYTTAQRKGYVEGSAWNFTVRDYREGSLLLNSDKVALSPDSTYFYKGYYRATMPFDLLVRYYYADGSDQWQFVKTYPAEGGQWTTAGLPITTGKNVVAAAFGYRLAGNGSLTLDNAYLEQRDENLYVSPAPAAGPALPVDRPQTVMPNHHFRYAFAYKSLVPCDVVVEYVLADGSRRFVTVVTTAPANELTRREVPFESISQAREMQLHIMPQRQGKVQVMAPTLVEDTRPGGLVFKQPLVSITFDDGWKSVYENAVPVLRQYHFPATYYLNPSVIDTKAFLTSMQVQNLHNAGDELAAHGLSHIDLTAVNSRQIDFQMAASQRYVKQKLHEGPIDFAVPYGKNDAETQFYARRYFRSLRGTESGINTRQNLDPYNLRVLYIDSRTTSDEIRRALNDAKASNGWLILIYHRVEYINAQTKDSKVIVSPLIFRQHMGLLRQSGISVKTVQQALDEVAPLK